MNLIDLLSSPWAVLPERLLEMQEIYAAHMRGEIPDIAAVEARLGRPLANEQQEYRLEQGGIAVLPIQGVIANKANLMTRVSGGASAQMLTQQVASMRSDPRVRGAVLDFDTPGGSVFGIPALAAEIRALAAEKPTASVSTGMMASAGYWTGSAANAVYLSGSTDHVGSIGVVSTHSYNPARQGGAQVTEVTAGRYKRMASDTGPLTKEGRAYLQTQVDELYRAFVEAVADNRRASVDDVLEHMADGRIFIGRQAIEAGLADGIATVDAIVEQMATSPDKFTQRRRATFALGGITESSASAGATPAGSELATTTTEAQTMTPTEAAATFAAENPEAAALLRAEGRDAEMQRVQDVHAAALPGHEALIERLASDGKTTGAEAAMAVLAAERQFRTAAAAARRDDAPAPVPTDATEASAVPPASASAGDASMRRAAAVLAAADPYAGLNRRA